MLQIPLAGTRFLLAVTLFAPLVAGCQPADSAEAPAEVPAAEASGPAVQPSPGVADATRQVLSAFQNSDADAIRAAFSDSALVAIGTDPAEYLRGATETADLFVVQAEAMTGMTVAPGDIDAYERGDVGWSASQPTFRFPDGTNLPVRLTVVFERDGGDWRVVQWHASLAVANAETPGFDEASGP